MLHRIAMRGKQYLRQYTGFVLPRSWSSLRMRVFFVMSILLGSVLILNTVYALDLGGMLIGGASWMLLTLAQICMLLTIFFLKAFISLASYNNYIDVGIVKLGWVMVRDVANMFFVVALLIIAFATMLGLEKYEWKKSMAKLILMAILINFSNLIAQLIIDVAHVFTVTFLNAIATTAGGNLIQMFNLGEITKMVSNPALGTTKIEYTLAVFGASVTAFMFAVIAALSIGSYFIVMCLRVVTLWALIILSPIAFLAFAMPSAESYAQEWWKKFSNQVIVAPVMVFFLWLAFATLGQGQILNQLATDNSFRPLQNTNEIQSVSLSQAGTWENMASFIIAVLFLWIGLEKTKDTGAVGAGMVSGAMGFAKKVATIASGYAAGRWLARKGLDIGVGALKDYSKLGTVKVFDTKVGKFIKEATGVGMLKRSGIRRKAAVEKLEEYKKNKTAAIAARGGGLSGFLAPTEKKRAQAAFDKDLAERNKVAETKKVEGNFKLHVLQEEEKKYNQNYQELLKIEEGEREKKAEEVRNRMKAEGKSGEEIEEKINELMPISELERANLRREAAKKTGGYVEMLHHENEGARPTGKFETEQKRVVAGVVDEQRVQEGKARKALRAFEMGQIKEDLEDYENYSYDELMGEIQNNLRIMKKYKGRDEETLSKTERTELKNARQNQGRALASAYTKGDGEFLASQLVDVDDSFKDVDFNKGQNSHIVDMALLSGASLDEFKDSKGSFDTSTSNEALAIQGTINQTIMDKMLEKSDILMRGLMIARDLDASKHNSLESVNQLSVGVDKHGKKVISYSNVQGSGKRATGKNLFASGKIDTTGSARREGKYKWNMQGKRLKDIAGGSLGDGRSRKVKIGDTEIELVMDFVNDEVKDMVADVGDMTVSEIKGLTREQINRIFGGQYDRSSYFDGKFVVGSEKMSQHLKKIFERFNVNYLNTESPAVKDNIKRAIRTILTQVGEKDTERMKIFVDNIITPKKIDFSNILRVATEEEDVATKT